MRLRWWMLLLAIGPGLVPARATPAAAADSTAVSTVDYLWVMRTSLVDPAGFPALVDRARAMGVRGLLVQVVGRGDAYYRSDLLPRAEALAPDAGDPLGALIPLAHAAGLEVHAWMNCMLVWSAPWRPHDPAHILNAHPEWLARMKDGRRLSQLSPRQRERMKIEGAFLAPANPEVRHFVAAIAAELARRYPVDGIHLDYIREPGAPVGYDSETRARFALASGVDPARFDLVPRERRAAADSEWAAFRRDQVTATVREVRDSILAIRAGRAAAVRAARPDSATLAAWRPPLVYPAGAAPARGLALSAAVLSDTIAARERHAQAWTEWVRDGLIDRAFAMCYAAPVQIVVDQLMGYSRSAEEQARVVPGIAVYNTRPAIAAAKILAARALGFHWLALYSYDALTSRPGYWATLKSSLGLGGGDRP